MKQINSPVAHQSISKNQLAQYLSIGNRNITQHCEALGLGGNERNFPWRRIFRCILHTEGTQLATHLKRLQKKHPESVILGLLKDLEVELTRPLLTFKEMAELFGEKSNTLSRAIREKRIIHPFQTIKIGQHRRYCPLEVELWRDEEIVLNLPKTSFRNLPREPQILRSPTAKLQKERPDAAIKKAVFSPFGDG